MAQIQTRMTRQRAVILEELRKAKTHPTADELYSIVRELIHKDRSIGLESLLSEFSSLKQWAVKFRVCNCTALSNISGSSN